VPPPIRPILEHLGLWQSFVAGGHSASYRTLSAWGSAALGSNEFLLQPYQAGWRLDRAEFDAMLVRAAARRVALHLPARVSRLAYADGAWHLACGDGSSHTARVVVDATGRAAALARAHGLRPRILDRLVGCFVYFDAAGDANEELMIEAWRDGWWYTAVIPGDRRVVACMSDADLMRQRGIARPDGWICALAETRHVRSALRSAQPLARPRLQPAGSRHVIGNPSAPMISVGDAASCFDPISGQGIAKALRAGIFASYALADALCRGDETALARYRAFVAQEFSAYRETLGDYYGHEQRWADRPFWQRRHRGGSQDATLSPKLAAASGA
jgi:flavin-dependent dehydrogenase